MSYINVNNDYKDMIQLTPFKACVLQNFPFIEADFDAVTNYQLLCKVVEYLNKVIANSNTQNDNISQLEQNFITLYNYVKNYFDNLDIQEEINKKLDKMAVDGTLSTIINEEIFGDLNKKIDNINYSCALYLGNSYSIGVGSTSGQRGIYELTKNLFTDSYLEYGSGTGFYAYKDHQNDTFFTLLDKHIANSAIDKEKVTHIIVVGAWGETRSFIELTSRNDINAFNNTYLELLTEFQTKVLSNYPNVKEIFYVQAESRLYNISTVSNTNYAVDCLMVNRLLSNLFNQLSKYRFGGWIGFSILYRSGYFSSDNYHPNDRGYNVVSNCFKKAFLYNNNIYQKFIGNKSIKISTNATLVYSYIFTDTGCDIFLDYINVNGSFNTITDYINININDNSIVPFLYTLSSRAIAVNVNRTLMTLIVNSIIDSTNYNIRIRFDSLSEFDFTGVIPIGITLHY